MKNVKIISIINGYLDDTFKPDSKINKVEALKIIGESLKWDIKETAKSQTAFTDIEEKEWYAPYIKYAENKKLIPEQENIFSPNENITRGETAEILYRSIALKQIPLKIKTNQTKSETLQISPEITISAKWEDKKTDLDAHFLGKNEEIYFIHRLSNNQKILLNSSSSQNPLEEEMIIKELPKGENTYFLHYYSGKKTFASSKTTVEIYDKNGLAKIYAPPDSKGEIWEVFSINGKGEITEINKIETCEESELSTAICSRPLN
ncbi:S-layer homology domain-containing protein [Candidatus Peregrinibacteria bacterium]|nr:S-layer homology domain-containing protein [Candidatus Peregrinibacteria bacterium]